MVVPPDDQIYVGAFGNGLFVPAQLLVTMLDYQGNPVGDAVIDSSVTPDDGTGLLQDESTTNTSVALVSYTDSESGVVVLDFASTSVGVYTITLTSAYEQQSSYILYVNNPYEMYAEPVTEPPTIPQLLGQGQMTASLSALAEPVPNVPVTIACANGPADQCVFYDQYGNQLPPDGNGAVTIDTDIDGNVFVSFSSIVTGIKDISFSTQYTSVSIEFTVTQVVNCPLLSFEELDNGLLYSPVPAIFGLDDIELSAYAPDLSGNPMSGILFAFENVYNPFTTSAITSDDGTAICDITDIDGNLAGANVWQVFTPSCGGTPPWQVPIVWNYALDCGLFEVLSPDNGDTAAEDGSFSCVVSVPPIPGASLPNAMLEVTGYDANGDTMDAPIIDNEANLVITSVDIATMTLTFQVPFDINACSATVTVTFTPSG